MTPEKIENANLQLGAPKNWDDAQHGECGALFVLDDGASFWSAWRPSEEELVAMAKGAPVFLRLYGRSHPPVSVMVGLDDAAGVPS